MGKKGRRGEKVLVKSRCGEIETDPNQKKKWLKTFFGLGVERCG